MSAEQTCRALLRAGTVEFGEFTYASGARGPIYIDLRRLVSFPDEMDVVCQQLAQRARELEGTELILGAATAGIPFASLMSTQTRIPMCYIRKSAKGHGRQSQIEGCFEKGQRALLVDDLVTSGASKQIFVEGARQEGLEITDLLVVLDRRADDDGGAIDKLAVQLHSLITLRELLEIVRADGSAKAEDLARVDKWLKGEAW